MTGVEALNVMKRERGSDKRHRYLRFVNGSKNKTDMNTERKRREDPPLKEHFAIAEDRCSKRSRSPRNRRELVNVVSGLLRVCSGFNVIVIPRIHPG